MIKTKSNRIRHLLKQGMRPKEVAEIVGCSADYVRAVRQRSDKHGNSARSPAQRRWAASEPGRAYKARYMRKRRATDPEFRKRLDAATARWRAKRHATDPEFRKRKAAANARYYAKRRAAEAVT